MGNYSESFLARRRQEWMNQIKRFTVLESGAWYDAVINSMNVEGTDIIVYVYIANRGKSGTITRIRALDRDGATVGDWDISIERSSVQNVLIKFTLPIKEV